jgi:hypothetical protein
LAFAGDSTIIRFMQFTQINKNAGQKSTPRKH